MNIGGIKINLPKLNNVQDDKNKPLANLKSQIFDIFVKEEDERPSVESAMAELRQMEDKDGNSRFSDYDIANGFKHLYTNKQIDLDVVKAFKDTTNFKFDNMSKIYLMKQDTKDDKFYDIVNSAIEKFPKDKSLTGFKQNIFEPETEFFLLSEKQNMDKLEKTLNTNYMTIGEEYKYNTKGDLLQKSNNFISISQGENSLLIKKAQEDYVNNTKAHQVQTLDTDGSPYVLNETITRKDKDGNLLRTEEMFPSKSIKGVYDVKYTYPNGKILNVSKSSIDSKTGIKTIKKDMVSASGTRTEFLYEDDPNGNRILDYKITDKNGKTLMKNSQTFEVISDKKFISSKNNYKYEITLDDNSMKIKDLHHETETAIDFEKKIKGNKKELIDLLKKVPGEELFETVDAIKKMNGKDKSKLLDSAYNRLSKNINISDNLFVFLHELGHAKDGEHNKKFLDKLTSKNDVYSNDANIRKAYIKERENFNKTHSDSEREMIDYFIQAKGHYGGEWGGLKEVIAETNALTNTYTDEPIKCLGTRTQILQQHFPETIATIKNSMEYKNDIAAIEYYGT